MCLDLQNHVTEHTRVHLALTAYYRGLVLMLGKFIPVYTYHCDICHLGLRTFTTYVVPAISHKRKFESMLYILSQLTFFVYQNIGEIIFRFYSK